MQGNEPPGRRASGLSSRMAALLRPRRERLIARAHPSRAHPPAYEEEEVRARIYGWHSGTVEPPEPADSSRLARIQTGSPRPAVEAGAALGSQPTAEQVVPGDAAPRKGDEK
jgi:hypothetical protein